MVVDKELIQQFSQEITEICQEIKGYIARLPAEKEIFESCGQAVDRIYGTAMTTGHKEIGEYMLALKQICYMSGQSENEKGQLKVIHMLEDFLAMQNEIKKSLSDKAELQKLIYKMKLEKSKADLLNRKEFYSIQRKSCC